MVCSHFVKMITKQINMIGCIIFGHIVVIYLFYFLEMLDNLKLGKI